MSETLIATEAPRRVRTKPRLGDSPLCSTTNPKPEPGTDQIVHAGQQAWARLRDGNDLTDWRAVAGALAVGRDIAKGEAGGNVKSKEFKDAFKGWRVVHGFEELEKGLRSRLLKLHDNWASVSDMLKELTPGEQACLNHPQPVLRKWEAKTKPPPDRNKESPWSKLKAEHANALEQIHKLERQLTDRNAEPEAQAAEVEQAEPEGNAWTQPWNVRSNLSFRQKLKADLEQAAKIAEAARAAHGTAAWNKWLDKAAKKDPEAAAAIKYLAANKFNIKIPS